MQACLSSHLYLVWTSNDTLIKTLNSTFLQSRMNSIFMLGLNFVIVSMIMTRITSDSQAEELLERCTRFKVSTDLSTFLSSVNKTLEEMRKQLSNAHFVTAYEIDVFGMAQCRNYLSTVDCLACFDAGVTRIRRKCDATMDGAHFIYQGCFLRSFICFSFSISLITS